MSVLDAHLVVRRPGFTLDAAIAAEEGEIVAILGRNGSGKSTALAALAGLVPLGGGSVTVDGALLSRPGFTTPPERRRVGLLGQDPMLFPHLSALENVAFGPRAAGTGRVAARKLAMELLEKLRVAQHAARTPEGLSGGQQQRVALARALAAQPRILLLDEPLAALDVETAADIRHLLRGTLHGAKYASVLVTHDVLDAAVIADRLLILDNGRVVAQGPPAQVLGFPTDPFVASLAGLNLVLGVLSDGRVVSENGVAVSGLAEPGLGEGVPAAAVFKPAAVALYLNEPGGSPRNHWPCTVIDVQPGGAAGGAAARVRLSGGVAADLTPAAIADLELRPGQQVWAVVKAIEVRLYAR